MKYKNGEEFLNKIYQEMVMSDVVMHTAQKSDTPSEKIIRYLNRLENVHAIASTSEHKMQLLKEMYYKKYVIQELPDSYVELQRRIAREQGYGDIEVTESMKGKMLQEIQKNQKDSLDSWIEYFVSEDAMYPMWFKNYALQGVLKLGKFDKNKGSFQKRTRTTVEPYLSLNREVLSQVYDTLSHEIGENNLTEKDINAIEYGESFKKLYTYYVRNLNQKAEDTEIDGIWKKYDKGDNYKALWESLQGKSTGWCTAGKETCKQQLANGDFYVYYTKDKEGQYTNPRIAIRMNGTTQIAEVRGVEQDQNIEENMLEIVDKKLNEFPDKESYQQKVHDMKLLTEIDQKTKLKQELNIEELKFLYEINGKIRGFGWKEDPRIQKIRNQRIKKKDLANIYNCREDQVALNIRDCIDYDIVVYYGDLDYHNQINFSHLKVITGSARFRSLENATGLDNLQTIGKGAYFESLKDATGLGNLQTIGGYANFVSLKDATGLSSLQTIGEGAYFESLKDATGLGNLQTIGGYANFVSLKDATGLSSLQTIGGYADFRSLENATGLSSLQTIGGYANFVSLKDATGLSSLQTIGGYADFHLLKDATGLGNLQTIGGRANFHSLKDVTGLSSLQTIGGRADFHSLENATGLGNLQTIGGRANFHSLKDVTGLSSLQTIGGYADFYSLENATGLGNLQTIGGYANFVSLKDVTGLSSLQTIGGYADFYSLENATGLGNLQTIGGRANFVSLKDATGLSSLQTIGEDANFYSLENATGLGNLQTIGGRADFVSLKDATGLSSLQTIGGNAYFKSLEDSEKDRILR